MQIFQEIKSDSRYKYHKIYKKKKKCFLENRKILYKPNNIFYRNLEVPI